MTDYWERNIKPNLDFNFGLDIDKEKKKDDKDEEGDKGDEGDKDDLKPEGKDNK
ncbi:hypothetical protein K449DRAFT_384798, partial [Hypoxylon sp. EC38]